MDRVTNVHVPGTCVNTIEPDCYEKYTPQVEVGDYFQKAVDLFKELNTYKVGPTR